MLFKIKNYAPINAAEVPLDGLTVIAGENSSGKSTIGKLLFSLVKAANRSKAVKERSDINENSLLRTHLNLVFGRDARSGNLQLALDQAGGTQLCEASIDRTGRVTSFSYQGCPLRDALFIDTPIVWQLFQTFQGITASNAENEQLNQRGRIQYPYTLFNVYNSLNGSVAGHREVYDDIARSVDRIAGGSIQFENGNPYFVVQDVSIAMQSLATGIQSFAILQRILELGLAERTRVLILDEPEVHLHPKWQLEYAKILVQLVLHTEMPILLTTHSAVFVEALEYIGQKHLRGKCNFMLTERGEFEAAATVKNVTGNLEPIYNKLAYPLIRLSLKKGDA